MLKYQDERREREEDEIIVRESKGETLRLKDKREAAEEGACQGEDAKGVSKLQRH